MDFSAYLRAFSGMKNEHLLRIEEVEEKFRIDLSECSEQDVLYECVFCDYELSSRDVIGFDCCGGIVYVGYICPVCYAWSKRPATDLEYTLFLDCLNLKNHHRNRFHSGLREMKGKGRFIQKTASHT